MNEAHIEQLEDRPDHEETEPYDGVALLDERGTPEPAKVLWTKVTDEAAVDDGDRPTLDMGKAESAVGSALVWDDDEPSVGDVYGYGRWK